MGSEATTVSESTGPVGTAGVEPERGEPPTASPAQAADEAADGQRGRWLVLVALVVGFALHIGWRLWLIRTVSTPIAHADEDRYLLSARVLAGGPGGLGNDTAAFRRMGYPVLLAPIYNFTSDPFRVYHLAQVVGATVNALTFPLAYLFASRVFGVRRLLALGLAFVAASLPAVAYYAEFTLTDVLFAPIGLAWLLLIHGWLANRTPAGRAAAAIGAGAVVGYAYTVHVRGLVMLGVHLGVLALVTFFQRPRWKIALASVVTAAVASGLDTAAQRIVGDRLVRGGVEPGGRLFDRLTDAAGLVQTLCDAAGQFWYLSVGTWGLGGVGIVIAVLQIRGWERDTERVDLPRRVTLAVALAATILIALSSAAALPEDGRVSNHVYFRYIAFLAPVWVMLGAATLIGAGFRRTVRLYAMAAGLTLAATFLALTQLRYNEWFHPFDTPEVSFLTYTWNKLPLARATLFSLILLVVVAVALARCRPGRNLSAVLTLVAIVVLNVGVLEVVNAKSIRPMVAAQYGTAPQLVRDIKVTRDDVIVTSKYTSLGARLNHQREVYWRDVLEFNHRAGDAPPPDATVVIAPWLSRNHDDWHSSGWRRAAGDPVQEWAVWLRTDDPRFNGAISAGNGR